MGYNLQITDLQITEKSVKKVVLRDKERAGRIGGSLYKVNVEQLDHKYAKMAGVYGDTLQLEWVVVSSLVMGIKIPRHLH
ncbi:MAG: hypothetical protein HN842_08610 [Gammaproteobacteria bacterium]|jgi:hypothetical protein|nr:hypothetical protein [Gammaproteobacteria bacterium]